MQHCGQRWASMHWNLGQLFWEHLPKAVLIEHQALTFAAQPHK
jgi:hypothetical protein